MAETRASDKSGVNYLTGVLTHFVVFEAAYRTVEGMIPC